MTDRDAVAHARDLLRDHPLIDGHNDLPWTIRTSPVANGEVGRYSLELAPPPGQTDLPRLRQGGVGGQFWSVYVPGEPASGLARMQLEQIDLARRMIAAHPAKAAIHAWAKGLSREVGKHGITVNSIPPGRINSEQIRRNYAPDYRQWQADNEIPVGRHGEPEDVAGLVSFLVSPLAGYITGTVIPVDGGLRRYQF